VVNAFNDWAICESPWVCVTTYVYIKYMTYIYTHYHVVVIHTFHDDPLSV